LEAAITKLDENKNQKQLEVNSIEETLKIKNDELTKVNQEMEKAKQTIFGLLKREEKIKKATPLIKEYYKKAGLNIELDI